MTSLSPGEQTLRVQVSDSAGRTATHTIHLTVRDHGTDLQAPVVTITEPAQDPIPLLSGRPLTLSGTARDDIALRSVTWRLSGSSRVSGSVSAMGPWSYRFASFSPGT